MSEKKEEQKELEPKRDKDKMRVPSSMHKQKIDDSKKELEPKRVEDKMRVPSSMHKQKFDDSKKVIDSEPKGKTKK